MATCSWVRPGQSLAYFGEHLQAPSTVNNGARALEGLIARYFFDNDTSVEGTLSGSVIQITANRDSLTLTGTTSNYVANFMQAWTQGATANPSPCSLNIDAVGPIALRDNRGATLSSSVILSGTRCLAVKDNANNYFRLIWPHSENAPQVSDVLTTEGDVLYQDGSGLQRLAIGSADEVLTVNSGATAPEWAATATATLGTPQASTSGTEIDFTGIPATATQVVISFDDVSTDGTDIIMIQVGDSGGFETSGYDGQGALFDASTTAISANSAGFKIEGSGAAARVRSGSITLTLLNSTTNIWAASGNIGRDNTIAFAGGRKALSATLTQVRITTTGGTDAFDNGSINIRYE